VLDGCGADIERVREYVDEDRDAARAGYRACCSEEGERRRYDLVARLQIERLERKDESVGSGSASNRPAGVAVIREVVFESLTIFWLSTCVGLRYDQP